jgi:ABC-2 type transport system permease protein
MSDILTIMWKEWKDSLFQGGWRAWTRPVLLIGILGVFEPLVSKGGWIKLSALELAVFLWFTFFVIISVVADSFAGERERHTLETLLASRMPDFAIFLGKVVSVVLYGWGVMVIGLFLGAVVSNLAHGQGSFVFYPTDMLLFTLGLGLLVGIMGAGAGVLLSLRMSTVRQVQQTLSIGTLVFLGLLLALSQLLPKDFFVTYTIDQILLMAGGVIVVLDVLLLGFSVARFQRAKLILS